MVVNIFFILKDFLNLSNEFEEAIKRDEKKAALCIRAGYRSNRFQV